MTKTVEPPVDVFEDITAKIKVRKGERILSKEAYAEDLYKLMLGYDDYDQATNHLKEGDVVEGKIVLITEQYIALDIRSKDYLYVELKQDELNALVGKALGETISVLVTQFKQDPFEVKGSYTKCLRHNVEVNMKKLALTDSVFRCYVKELTPAGYLVDVLSEDQKFPAFMPNTLAGVNKVLEPQSLIGVTMDVMLEGYSDDKKTFIASRRKYLDSLVPSTIKDMPITDSEGNYIGYSGIVTGIKEFGVFVEVKGHVTGLLHKSNIEPELDITKIEEGREIEFYIKEKLKSKLILTRVIRETIWDTIKPGKFYEGTVKSMKQFGALITLDEETIGLIHAPELQKCNVTLGVDDKVRVKVLQVNREERKIFLTVAPAKTKTAKS